MTDDDRSSDMVYKPFKRISVNGRYYLYALDRKGRILSRTRWSQNTSFQLRQRFKDQGSFRENIRVSTLSKVDEITEDRYITDPNNNDKNLKTYRVRIRKNYDRYQVSARGILRDGRVIVARSGQHDTDFAYDTAEAEALESFWELLAQANGLSYDAEEGRKISNKVVDITFSVVYYRKR